MLPTTPSRVTLLKRAQSYKAEINYGVVAECCAVSTPLPCQFHNYERLPELVVPADPYGIWPATLRMNWYNSLFLQSPTMFIADIDNDDPRLSPSATVKDKGEILKCVNDLQWFDAKHLDERAIRGASWRLYRTHSGYRLICTSHPIGHGGMWYGLRLLSFFEADPMYIAFCKEQRCFHARLTPKPWRGEEGINPVCSLIEKIGNEVHPALSEQLRLHDELTIFEDVAGEGLA